jgi:hypothetical protein
VRRERLLARDLGGQLVELGDVPVPAALRDQPPARAEGAMQPLEEARVVGDPVENRVGERGVHLAVQLEVHKVGLEDRGPLRVEGLAGRLDHRRRRVDGHDAALRQPVEQQPGDAPAAAARVQHRLVALERQAVENDPRPLDLGVGDALVGGGVPVPRAHSAVVTGPERSRSCS